MIVSKIYYNLYTSYQNRYINKPEYVSPNLTFTSDNSKDKASKIPPKNQLASAAIATLVIGIALIGRKIRNNYILKQIPIEYQEIFKRLKGKRGLDFLNTAYAEMLSHMGLKENIPEKPVIEGKDGISRIISGYYPQLNKISFSPGVTHKIDRVKQLGLISHELTHAKQYSTILRTEGLGADALAEALAESYIKNAVKSNTDDSFYLAYNDAKKIGYEKNFLEAQQIRCKYEFKMHILKNHVKTLSMPKYKIDSPEGQKALEYIEAQKNYEFLSPGGFGSENYKNNLLEIEAYGYGDKIKNLYKKYLSLL